MSLFYSQTKFAYFIIPFWLQLALARYSSPVAMKTKLHHYSPQEVAEELCLIDAELLRKIRPEELEKGAWMKNDKVNFNIVWMWSAAELILIQCQDNYGYIYILPESNSRSSHAKTLKDDGFWDKDLWDNLEIREQGFVHSSLQYDCYHGIASMAQTPKMHTL